MPDFIDLGGIRTAFEAVGEDASSERRITASEADR